MALLARLLAVIAAIRGTVNSEPAIFLFSITFGVLLTANPLVLFWLRCVQIVHSDTDIVGAGQCADPRWVNASNYCAQIDVLRSTQELDVVERDVAQLAIYRQAIASMSTVISAPLLGAWSDYRGRKAPYLVAVTGLVLYCFTVTLGIHLYTTASIYLYVLMAEFLGGLFGAASVSGLAMTVVADDSRRQLSQPASGIPLRIGIGMALLNAGISLGSALNGFFEVPLKTTVVMGDGDEGNVRHVDGYFWTLLVSKISLSSTISSHSDSLPVLPLRLPIHPLLRTRDPSCQSISSCQFV